MQIPQGIAVSPGMTRGETLVVDDHSGKLILRPDQETVARRAIEWENARQVDAYSRQKRWKTTGESCR